MRVKTALGRIFLTLAFLSAFSCAQRLKTPLNRMISPEAIGRGAQLEYRKSGFSEAKLNFADGRTDNPLDMGTISDPEFVLGLGIVEKVDFFYKMSYEATALLGIKFQLVGEAVKAQAVGHKLALTYAMGSDRDDYDGIYKIRLKSSAQDFSVIHGYRFSEYLMLYESLSLSQFSMSGSIENGGGEFSSDSFDYRTGLTLGLHVGLELSLYPMLSRLELGVQKIKWSQTEEYLAASLGYSLGLVF